MFTVFPLDHPEDAMQRTATTLLLVLSTYAMGCANDTTVPPTRPSQTTGNPINANSKERYTLAVIGDFPYGDVKLGDLPNLISEINGDPKVDLVAHLGDIKAGKNTPCTDEYFSKVETLFDGFDDPFVYTPGDNEWTDCHVATKNNGLYTPTERLQAIRNLFFPVAGQTLGGRKKQVLSQASDAANAAYIENAMWMESQVVFATLNITGSNNDLVSWETPLPADAGNYPSQAEEQTARAQANSAWLAQAFATAAANHAAGVVLMFQADMWDQAEPSLSGFGALVQQIGSLAAEFGKPVLLLEGDSHAFRVDQPYSASSPLHALHAATPIADNVTRIVVEGSDAGRTEYLRLTVDPRNDNGLFTWERVPLQ
jgi:hypothetical protein